MCEQNPIGRLTSSLVACVAVAATARSQTTLFTLNGPGTSEFGASVARAGDVNLDGRGDFIVGAPAKLTSGFQTGAAYVYSGTGSLLFTIPGDPGSNDRLGSSVAGAGDVDGDGRPDLVVGVPYDDTNGNTNNGTVRVYSGANGALLRTFHGSSDWDRFGWSVDGPGDVNGDGRGDVIAGVNYSYPGGPGLGYAKVYSGSTGALLYSWAGPTDGSLFGWSVSGAGDVNLDGRPDLIVGAPFDGTAGSAAGSARVYSGANGLPLHTRFGSFSDAHFGWGVADAGDLNGDGRPDVVVGAPGIPCAVHAYSGDGTSLWSQAGTGEFGWSLSGAGDVDSDGRGDVVVGEPAATQNGNGTGRITVLSGATGLALFSLLPPAQGGNGRFGESVDGPLDLNGDLRPDFLAGGPAYDLPGTDYGIVRAYGSNLVMVSFCHPGLNGVAPCPCGNPPTTPGRGCNNFGTGPVDSARITAVGASSLSADTLVLIASGENSTSFSIFLQGTSSVPAGAVFGAGIRCVGGALRRLYTGSASGGTLFRPGASDPSVSARSAALGDLIAPGQHRTYMVYYRDQGAAVACGDVAATFNATQSGDVIWSP